LINIKRQQAQQIYITSGQFMSHFFRIPVITLLLGAGLSAVHAAPIRLDEVASKTLQTNPEVLSKWHDFKASLAERDVTLGRYLPTLDVIYGTAFQHRDSPLFIPPGSERRYNTQNARVTIRQNLFEGFTTHYEASRLEHASLVRFYEMMDRSENAALEASRAYIDVWRYRKLVQFAEDNYATHRIVYEKVRERAESGVGRRVDLETAAGRLALAESNLLTETSNLHDVNARYQRVVGELPKAEMEVAPAVLGMGLPKTPAEGISMGFEKSPQLKAAFENIRVARLNIDTQQSGFSPRVDAYIERSRDLNQDGFYGLSNERTAGITVSWNLFRGMQDVSRHRQAAEEFNSAKDQREKTCREVRQNLAIAFNDHQRLTEQLQYLDQHQLSADKVREAFRRQYDIGQRTLLDLLDTENEYYTARRNYLNNEQDLMIADARYQAISGNLLTTLNLKNLNMTPPKLASASHDIYASCPAEPVPAVLEDKEAIFQRALSRQDRVRVTGGPGIASTPVAIEPLAPVRTDGTQPKPEAGTRDEGRVAILTWENFYFGSDKLKPAADARLRAVIEFYRKNPEANIQVIGHYDSPNISIDNQKVSEARANTVKNWLARNGIPADQITAAGVGKTQPLTNARTNQAHARNSRVEISYSIPAPR
jgi:adhesin transport system outer membrane protein